MSRLGQRVPHRRSGPLDNRHTILALESVPLLDVLIRAYNVDCTILPGQPEHAWQVTILSDPRIIDVFHENGLDESPW